MVTDNNGWSPYLAGALAGLVLVLSVLVAGKYFGSSTSFVRAAGMIEQAVAPERTAEVEYFKRIVPKVDWQWMFLVGVLIGSFVSSITSGSFGLKSVPEMWRKRFGGSATKRGLAAFVGGIIILIGARIAGG